MAINAVLFDIDGTLVDSNDYHVAAWEEAFAGIGVRLDRQRLHDQMGKGTDMLVPTLLPELDENAQKSLGEVQGAAFRSQYLDRVQPFPDAHALLARVHKEGRKVVLASSASEHDLDHYIELLGVRDMLFDTTSSDDVENTKPAPDIFASALKKVEPLTPEEVVVVGDTPYDIVAAKKCGISAIGLRSGNFSDQSLKEAGAVAIYDDVAHLLAEYDTSLLAN